MNQYFNCLLFVLEQHDNIMMRQNMYSTYLYSHKHFAVECIRKLKTYGLFHVFHSNTQSFCTISSSSAIISLCMVNTGKSAMT